MYERSKERRIMKNNLLLGKSTVRPVMNTLYLGGARCEKSNFMKKNIKNLAMKSIADSREAKLTAVESAGWLTSKNIRTVCGKASDETGAANLIVLDLMDDIYNDTKETLLKGDYRVLHCNVMDNIYNPFTYMKTDESILNFADIIAKKANTKDLFWYTATRRMLIEYLMHYKETGDLSDLSMKALYDVCADGSIEAYVDYRTVCINCNENVGPTAAHNVVLNLAAFLQPYKDLDGTGAYMFDLPVLFTENKQALFLEMDVCDTTPNLMYNIMLSQLFCNIAVRTKPLEHELFFFLDEVQAISLPVSNSYLFSELDRLNAVIITAVQSIKQVDVIRDAFPLILYAGTMNDMDTACYLKEIAKNSKKTLKARLSGAYKDLLDEYRLMRLNTDDIYIIEQNKPIIKDKKLAYEN